MSPHGPRRDVTPTESHRECRKLILSKETFFTMYFIYNVLLAARLRLRTASTKKVCMDMCLKKKVCMDMCLESQTNASAFLAVHVYAVKRDMLASCTVLFSLSN